MKPTVEFGLGMLIGTVVGTGLAILFAPVPATTTRWLLLSPDLDERHQAGARIPPPDPLAQRTATSTSHRRQATQHVTARDPIQALLSAGNTA